MKLYKCEQSDLSTCKKKTMLPIIGILGMIGGSLLAFNPDSAQAVTWRDVVNFGIENSQHFRDAADAITTQTHYGSVSGENRSPNDIRAACVDLAFEKGILVGQKDFARATRGFAMISTRKENGAWQCYRRHKKP